MPQRKSPNGSAKLSAAYCLTVSESCLNQTRPDIAQEFLISLKMPLILLYVSKKKLRSVFYLIGLHFRDKVRVNCVIKQQVYWCLRKGVYTKNGKWKRKWQQQEGIASRPFQGIVMFCKSSCFFNNSTLPTHAFCVDFLSLQTCAKLNFFYDDSLSLVTVLQLLWGP